MPRKGTKKSVETSIYTASIRILGRNYTSEGVTAKEAIENLKPVGTAKGMSILTIAHEKSSKEKILTAPQTFRLFNGGRIMKEVAVKNTSLMFDGI